MSIVDVFVVDVSPGGYPTGITYVPNRPDALLVQVRDPGWRPLDIAGAILAKVAERGTQTRIRQLHLASHGNSGELFMASGINIGNVNGMSILAGHLVAAGAFSASVFIHGCAVASSVVVDDGCMDNSNPGRPVGRTVCLPTPGRGATEPTGWAISGGDMSLRIRSGRGYQFLAAMARSVRASVRSAVHAQDVDRVGQTGWRIEGAYMTVRADGHGTLVDTDGNIGISSEPSVYEF